MDILMKPNIMNFFLFLLGILYSIISLDEKYIIRKIIILKS